MRQLLSLLTVTAAFTVPLLVAGLHADPAKPPAARAGVSPRALAADVPAIAGHVERIRELRYERLPKPRLIGVRRLARLNAREQKRDEHRRQVRAGEAALKLVGLLAPDDRVADLSAQLAEETAGAYDAETGRLYLVRTPGVSDRALVEITLAHELDHALEDQRFGLPQTGGFSDDRALAAESLVEGSATEVMFLYARRYVDPAALLEAAADPEVLRSAAASQLPEAIEAELAFTYFRGRTFVTALRRLSGRWNLVDIAFRSRPPVSSEQILHPYKYLTYERPLPVRLGVGETLDKPWRRFGGGVFGEFDTFQLLRLGNGERTARRAAAGWGGQRSLLWRRGRAPCAGACRSRDALVAAWRWDSRADRRQFERALRGYLEQGLSAQRMGPRLWSLRGGSIALAGRGAGTGLAFAPRARLARRLAGR